MTFSACATGDGTALVVAVIGVAIVVLIIVYEQMKSGDSK